MQSWSLQTRTPFMCQRPALLPVMLRYNTQDYGASGTASGSAHSTNSHYEWSSSPSIRPTSLRTSRASHSERSATEHFSLFFHRSPPPLSTFTPISVYYHHQRPAPAIPAKLQSARSEVDQQLSCADDDRNQRTEKSISQHRSQLG
jgi:hypothetical protein